MFKIQPEAILAQESFYPDVCNDAAIVDIEETYKKPTSHKFRESNGSSASEVIEIARTQFNNGTTKSIEFRREQLKNLLKMFDENASDFEDAIMMDLRKHRLEASAYDVQYSRRHVEKMLMHLDEWNKPQYPTKPYVNFFEDLTIYNDPYGVVLIMAPWNFPLNLLFVPACGAIAAGNCVIFKPSEISAASAKIIAELLPKYLDKQCYHVYVGGIEETTDLLQQRFDYIFFTGSTAVGKIVHAAANKFLTPVTLELGGKSPVYLDDTVDLELATKRILWGKCLNAGQICISPDYLLCTKEVQNQFLAAAKNQLTEWYTECVKNSPDYARIINDKDFQRLSSFLLDKKTIAIGGQTDATQRFIEPTILINVNHDDPVMQEEIFGPILPIMIIKDVVEAISFINAREKPLALYIFSNDKKTKKLMLDNTSSGGVTINDTIMHFTAETLPFGGVGMSGMGSCHAKASFDTFVHKKSILEKDYSKPVETLFNIRYPPYSDRKTELLNMVLRPRRAIPAARLKQMFSFLLGLVFLQIAQYIINRVKQLYV